MAHMHIENGRQWVASATKELVESSKTSKGALEAAKSSSGTKAIAELVKNVPKYQKLYSKLSIRAPTSLHLRALLTFSCSRVFQTSL